MTTEAGKELLWSGYHRHSAPLVLGDMIAAIEAEARAAVLRELREEVQSLPTATRYFSDEDPPLRVVAMRSVLDAIDRRLGDG